MAAFSVTSVTERPTIDAAGNVVKSVVVTLRTMRGATGSVEIPSDQFHALTESPEGKQALQERLNAVADSLDSPFEM